jgi:rubrerythrin
MSKHVSMDVFDERPGIREALDGPGTTTRGRFLGRATVAGGALAGGGVAVAWLARPASAMPSPALDAELLNVVLLLEELEAAFYTEAERRAPLGRELRELAGVFARHEHAHVAFLRDVLGSHARKPSTFRFGRSTRERDAFARTAVLLEDTAVAAYNGQAANLTKRALAAAAAIVSVEARHAGWIRAVLGLDPAPRPSDRAMSAGEVMRFIRRTGFVRR